MRRDNKGYATGGLPFPPVAGNLPHRPGLRFSTPSAHTTNRGFIVPVLVVFAVLWFLLNGTHPI